MIRLHSPKMKKIHDYGEKIEGRINNAGLEITFDKTEYLTTKDGIPMLETQKTSIKKIDLNT